MKLIDFIKTNKVNIALILILIFGFAIRLVAIDLYPAGLNVDEASSRL